MSTSPTDFDAAALWDLVPDALFAVEDTGVIAAANDAASEMFGVASDEGLVGLPIEMLVDESARASHAAQRGEWTRSPTPRLVSSVPADETARRIEAVVDAMSDVVDSLDGSDREPDDQ